LRLERSCRHHVLTNRILILSQNQDTLRLACTPQYFSLAH
jgi:hypothetical protein